MKTRLSEWGNSLGVHIPKEIIDSLEWRRGDIVKFSLNGEILHIHNQSKCERNWDRDLGIGEKND